MFLDSISTQEKVDFVKNLALLIKSGKPVNESFDLLSRQARSSVMRKTLENAKEKSERGTPLHQIFEESPHFEKVFVSFIRAGEESGTLEKNLLNLTSWLERQHTLKKEIKSATLYPKIIVTFAVVLSAGLALFVLPNLVPIFATLDVELPLATRVLLYISNVMQDYGLYIIGGLAGFIFAIYLLFKLEPLKRLWHRFLLITPVAGSMAKDYQLTVISQLISTLFRSGLTINASLEIISDSVTNTRYQDALDQIRERVAKGTSFSETLKNYPDLFSEVFISVVATGEQTGSFGESFDYLSEFFATRLTEKSKRLPVVIEPLLLIGIGVFVFLIAIAIIMPIYEVTKGLY
ncbi:MAG: type II secretion system F family protein [Candidatus Pacebacteria bacterium]|nr:type II secretion system F family protein [Candidatus Paceibacterota bacterium]